jgi:hypothetical protein
LVGFTVRNNFGSFAIRVSNSEDNQIILQKNCCTILGDFFKHIRLYLDFVIFGGKVVVNNISISDINKGGNHAR